MLDGSGTTLNRNQELHMALVRSPKPGDQVEVITSCLRSKIETNFVPTASFAMGIADTLCPLSCAPAQDTDREVYTKSLKSLAQVIATPRRR